MYEELVQRLKNAANEKCFIGCFGICNHCEIGEALNQAADAIEELEKSIPRWIPVTERLPEEPYGCLAIVWDNPRYGDGDMFLNYYPEFVGWDGETWNDADGEEIPLDVVYWMKMPQIPKPPKEE